MSIAAGTRFGSYQVAEPIGVGGMGEVYRARDTELGRDVAIKVLPASFTTDAMRIARFEQEAKTLASLNHANIAHIYGLARGDGGTGIVLELVDGPTLADRIASGPIPVNEALEIAQQLAAALEAAHERGIVHRDLKPANVKLTLDGTVKVLDFGIAKALDPRQISGPGPATLTTPAMTEAGFILGTAAYMSPEQAKGKPIDQRTDVWAFGCVLYEMLAGKPAFLGEDVTSTLARVLEAPLRLNVLPSDVSPSVRRTLELCLEKDARKRIADMRDVRLGLAGAFAAPPADTRPSRRFALPVAAAAAAAALLGGAGAWLLKPAPAAEPKIVARFDYPLPAGVDLRDTMTSVLGIAPGGELFAFNGTGGIYVRRMGETEPRLLPGTAPESIDGVAPDVVVSPDGREVAFFRGPPGRLLKTAIDGGTPVVLTEVATAFPYGLTWEPGGTLYYGQIDGVWRVSANGGTPEQLIKTAAPEQVYRPQLLPGGQWLMFTLARVTGANRWNEADIVIQSLASGERRVLRSGGFDARYLPTGHVTYMSGDVLFASTFDAATLTLGAERVPVVQGVRTASPAAGGSGFYAVSNNGTLAFVPPDGVAAGTARPRRGLFWVDRAGNATPLRVRPDDYTMARLSPDGSKIALVVGSAAPFVSVPAPDLYLFDIEAESLTQLTFNPATDDGPVWSRDGRRIYYRARAAGEGDAAVYALAADGGAPELVGRSQASPLPIPWSLSPDDTTLLLVDAVSSGDVILSTIDLGTDGIVRPLLRQAGIASEPSLSPNGQWLVYQEGTFAAGAAFEINVRPYPDVGQQRRPVAAGTGPVFAADGSELFFFDGEGLSVAAVQYAPFRVGSPRPLFRGTYWWGAGGVDGSWGRAWDVDSKNGRFLVIASQDQSAARQVEIRIVLNWFEELERRVPARRGAAP